MTRLVHLLVLSWISFDDNTHDAQAPKPPAPDPRSCGRLIYTARKDEPVSKKNPLLISVYSLTLPNGTPKILIDSQTLRKANIGPVRSEGFSLSPYGNSLLIFGMPASSYPWDDPIRVINVDYFWERDVWVAGCRCVTTG